MMDMTLNRFARLIFDHGNNDFHICARQIGALQLLPALGVEAVLGCVSPANATAAVAAMNHVLAITMRFLLYGSVAMEAVCAARPDKAKTPGRGPGSSRQVFRTALPALADLPDVPVEVLAHDAA